MGMDARPTRLADNKDRKALIHEAEQTGNARDLDGDLLGDPDHGGDHADGAGQVTNP